MNLAILPPPTAEQVLCMLHAEYLAADTEGDRKAKLKLLPIMARMTMQLHKAQQKKLKEEEKEKKDEMKSHMRKQTEVKLGTSKTVEPLIIRPMARAQKRELLRMEKKMKKNGLWQSVAERKGTQVTDAPAELQSLLFGRVSEAHAAFTTSALAV